MNRKLVGVFLVLVFVAAILATSTLLTDEPNALPQSTPTPLVWEYLEALDFARATCKEIVEPSVENANVLNTQTDRLLTLSGTMELRAFRSHAWPLEGKEACWVVLIGNVGQVFNFPQGEDPLVPHVVPVGMATLVFEDNQGRVVSLQVIHGDVVSPPDILGGRG
ncbi:MAG: hypothetical protein BMS9Abin34_191 [Patescibacteria group bacterium]|nr:MAG: hypothetical protein BMS9Abin34_191 [Patescibacteria group bacterium]